MSSPLKEPHFFAFEDERPNFQGPGDQELYDHIGVSDIDVYRALFQGVAKEKAIGEASVYYLYLEKARDRIQHYLPNVKLIVILRDPAERAYSNFLYMIRDDKEPLSEFALALQAEDERIQSNWGPLWHYKQVGFYYEQLQRYYEVFDREQIRVYLYEDLTDDPASLLRDACTFLGVDDAFAPKGSVKHNVSGLPRNKHLHVLHRFLLRPHPVKAILKPFLPLRLRRPLHEGLLNTLRNRNLVKPPFPVEMRQQLTEVYREDVLKLQELIQRDLSKWLQ
jgi:sulfotransferase family protein